MLLRDRSGHAKHMTQCNFSFAMYLSNNIERGLLSSIHQNCAEPCLDLTAKSNKIHLVSCKYIVFFPLENITLNDSHVDDNI